MAEISTTPARINLGSALLRQRKLREEKRLKAFNEKSDNDKKLKNVVNRAAKKAQTDDIDPIVQLHTVGDIKQSFFDLNGVQSVIQSLVQSQDKWARTIDRMNLKPHQKNLLYNTEIVKSEQVENRTFVTLLIDEEGLSDLVHHQASFERAMSEISKKTVKLLFNTEIKQKNTPNQQFLKELNQRKDIAKQAMAKDEKLSLLINAFEGDIIEVLPV